VDVCVFESFVRYAWRGVPGCMGMGGIMDGCMGGIAWCQDSGIVGLGNGD
jgi:hypothetical protein